MRYIAAVLIAVLVTGVIVGGLVAYTRATNAWVRSYLSRPAPPPLTATERVRVSAANFLMRYFLVLTPLFLAGNIALGLTIVAVTRRRPPIPLQPRL